MSVYPNEGQREYGLDQPETIEEETPKAKLVEDAAAFCPNCGCTAIHECSVKVKHPIVVGGFGQATWLGCPACPWASQAVIVGIAKAGA